MEKDKFKGFEQNNNFPPIIEEEDDEKPLNNYIICPICGKDLKQSTFDRHIKGEIEKEEKQEEEQDENQKEKQEKPHYEFSKKYRGMKDVVHSFNIFKRNVQRILSANNLGNPEIIQQKTIHQFNEIIDFVDNYEKKYRKKSK